MWVREASSAHLPSRSHGVAGADGYGSTHQSLAASVALVSTSYIYHSEPNLGASVSLSVKGGGEEGGSKHHHGRVCCCRGFLPTKAYSK